MYLHTNILHRGIRPMFQDLSNINYFTDFLFLPSEAVTELQLGDEANLF